MHVAAVIVSGVDVEIRRAAHAASERVENVDGAVLPASVPNVVNIRTGGDKRPAVIVNAIAALGPRARLGRFLRCYSPALAGGNQIRRGTSYLSKTHCSKTQYSHRMGQYPQLH